MLSCALRSEDWGLADYHKTAIMHIESVLRSSYVLASVNVVMLNIVPVRHTGGCAVRERLKSVMSRFVAKVCALCEDAGGSTMVVALGGEAHDSLDRGFKSMPGSTRRPRMIKVVNPAGVSRMLEPVTNESLQQAGYEKNRPFEADSWRLGYSSIHDTAVWS